MQTQGLLQLIVNQYSFMKHRGWSENHEGIGATSSQEKTDYLLEFLQRVYGRDQAALGHVTLMVEMSN